MPNPVYETMTTFKVVHWTVRVWREEPKLVMGPDEEVVACLSKVQRYMNLGYRVVDLVDAVKNLPRISAIEVLDRYKNGGLFYPDWR